MLKNIPSPIAKIIKRYIGIIIFKFLLYKNHIIGIISSIIIELVIKPCIDSTSGVYTLHIETPKTTTVKVIFERSALLFLITLYD
ncbi:MAG: hypothetical protein DSZ21_00485 [Tenericutes bacterium]|nr:MAG: hypothetical protein DSZ21_00485 [Mycoplasmatota bacterium]